MSDINQQIAEKMQQVRALRDQLEPLESGDMRMGERTAERPEWTDTTDNWIAHLRRVIGTYEQIIERLKQGTSG